MAYNSEYDHCKGIDASSGTTAKASADKMCELAFESLDNLKLNSCAGWRLPECRLISENDEHYQCSCKISTCNELGVKKNKVTSFRDCANHLWTEELETGVVPAPMADFQQLRSNYDKPWQDALYWQDMSYYAQDILNSAEKEAAAGSSSAHTGSAYAGSAYTGGAYTGGDYTGGDYTGGEYTGGEYTDGEYTGGEYTGGEYTGVEYTGGEYTGGAYAGAEYTAGEYTGGEYTGGEYTGGVYTDGENTYSAAQTPGFYGGPSTSYLSQSPEQPKGGSKRNKPGTGGCTCGVCGKSYTLKRVLTAHEKRHNTSETRCGICKKVLASKSGLKDHIKRRHPNISKSEAAIPKSALPGEGPDGSRFECVECGKTYTSQRTLRQHERTHKTLETHCFICNQTFGSKNGYKDHMETRHPEEAAAELEAAKEKRAVERPVKCKVCNANFKHIRGLRDHEKLHDGKTKCNLCGGNFSSMRALRVHRKQIHKVT